MPKTGGPTRIRRQKRVTVAVAACAATALALGLGLGRSSAAAAPVCSPTASAQLAAWSPDTARAVAYAHHRRGDISFEVRAHGRVWGYRSHHVVVTASVLKAMLLVAYLDLPSVRNRGLARADIALLTPMIRRSDNTAATLVRGIVGDRRLVALAHRVGMRNFRPAAIWGLSQTTADDQALFFLRIDAYIAPRHRSYALAQLASIIPTQRWGIGRVSVPGWTVYFKGGWGSGTGRVDHQVALLVHGCNRVSVAVMTMGDGTHAYGKQSLYGVFVRLLVHLPRYPRARPAG
jgi:hypothetical protein